MSEIQNRKGICIKTIDKTERQVLRIFFWSQLICLVPFWITDWAICYTNDYQQTCLLTASINNLSLWAWLFIDGFSKLLTFFIVFLVTLLDTQSMSRSYVSFNGNFIRLFYLFNFAWTVVGSVIFWGQQQIFYPFPFQHFQLKRVYTTCIAPMRGYIFFLLIFSYIIIPINLYISSLRPISQFKGQILMEQTTRRDTQLIEKPKNIFNEN